MLRLLHVRPILAPSPNLQRVLVVPGLRPSARRRLATSSYAYSTYVQTRRATATSSRALGGALRYLAFGAVGLSAAAYLRPSVLLEPATPTSAAAPLPQPIPAPTPVPAQADSPDDKALPPPPQSQLAPVELTFGLVCGVCAGVFVKKGAKAIAFTLGGIFVILQYLSINSFIRVDWQRISSKFEHLFYRTDPVTSKTIPPTLGSLWTWLVNFLTTDFQPRASFLAGLALGLRLG